jgi:acetyltransferase-like isoleucine patch superfamily enzyme
MKNEIIHPTAIISQYAILGENVEIGPFSIVHANVEIGSNSKIGAYSEIGIPTVLAKEKRLIIGQNATIRSHATIYQGSIIGNELTTGHYVTIRENSIIGESFQLGNRSDVQGDCEIGNHTKMHADVHIGKKTKIGNFVWLFPEVLITNDPTPPSTTLVGVTIEDYAVVASKTLIFPGVTIGEDSVIGAGSLIKEDVPKEKLVTGCPGKIICDAKILRMHNDPKKKAYPWRHRFHRGYPEKIVVQWLAEINTQIKK